MRYATRLQELYALETLNEKDLGEMKSILRHLKDDDLPSAQAIHSSNVIKVVRKIFEKKHMQFHITYMAKMILARVETEAAAKRPRLQS